MILRFITVALFCLLLLFNGNLLAQEAEFPFQNPDLDADVRVEDILKRLTLSEKVAQMQDVAPAIERLGITEYNWWNECLHGVARAGRATSFPQAIGMAATWNPDLIHNVADVISTEARAKFNSSIQKGQRNRYQGLTMWTPNINIFRDPRWGRGQETYGEDPYLTSKLAVAFVSGLQGDNPEYFKVIATPKHYAVHSGPEFNRHSFDAFTNKKDLWETYLPAFEAAVVEGKAFSVMSAYNRYLGESATASKLLLNDILRDKWGFKGYVVSDCGAVYDIYKFHNIVETAAEASALAVKAGCDLNCGNSYSHLVKAVENCLLTEEDIDVSLRRLLLARVKLGLFNPPGSIPFAEIDESYIEKETHAELALQAARESIVLLKNENNTLPISKHINSITVIGPNADDRHFMLGNYFGVPTKQTTILDGIRKKVSANTQVNYFKGVNIADEKPVFDVISSDNYKGEIKVEYFDNSEFNGKAVYTEYKNRIDFEWGGAAPVDVLRPGKFSIRYTGIIQTNFTNEVELAVLEQGGAYQLFINDNELIKGTSKTERGLKPKSILLEKGEEYTFQLDYRCTNEWMASIQLIWNLEYQKGTAYMMDVVNKSELIIYVGGITARLEGEEMPVEVDGFYKGDRTNLKLPEAQIKMLKQLHSTGKPVVFVLTTGSAIACNWEQQNLPAILNVWYPGQAGGAAIADVLFGDYNPSGKLPVTFYKSVNDLPDFEDYSMNGRTYRYFNGEALYPFGYGLSFTNFEVSKPQLQKRVMSKNETNSVTVEVSNTGNLNGDVVLQMYVRRKNSAKESPLKSLKGFKKIFVEKGATKTIRFKIKAKELVEVDKHGNAAVNTGEFEIYIGETSETLNKVVLELK